MRGRFQNQSKPVNQSCAPACGRKQVDDRAYIRVRNANFGRTTLDAASDNEAVSDACFTQAERINHGQTHCCNRWWARGKHGVDASDASRASGSTARKRALSPL